MTPEQREQILKDFQAETKRLIRGREKKEKWMKCGVLVDWLKNFPEIGGEWRIAHYAAIAESGHDFKDFWFTADGEAQGKKCKKCGYCIWIHHCNGAYYEVPAFAGGQQEYMLKEYGGIV